MHITEIFLSDWRNFVTTKIRPTDAINIFLGRNAQGKTNILEAINFASLGRSRAGKDFDLIRWGQAAALLRINFSKASVAHELAIEIAEGKRRRILFDANPLKPRELVGKLNSVLFSPEDLFMFKSSPAVRRKFLDEEISQASPVYFADLSKYNRLVDQRNNLLKKIRDGFVRAGELDLWDEQLAEFAAKVATKRFAAVDKLNFLANLMQRKISAQTENLSVVYEVHGLDDAARVQLKKFSLDFTRPQNFSAEFTRNFAACALEILRARRFSDVKRGATSLGAHLDDLNFFINGRELKLFGSQGQMRTAALALKLSELQFLKSETGEYPLLLLDDVMSELDAARREMLLNFLRREKIQTLITATDRAYFPPRSFGKFFFVKAGNVVKEADS